MTYEEALKDLKSIHYHKHGLYTDDGFAYEMAFEALGKQIPKKPIRLSGLCYCPYHTDVEYLFLNTEGEYWTVCEGQPYCEFCGQKLDWSEEE